jgi:putative cell wall-binding protein
MRKMPITTVVALTSALTLISALTLVAPAGAQAAAATFTRLAGADRYATAVAISQSAFQPQFPGEQFIVTVASGANFPDALAAGPLASSNAGPLLLVPQDGVLPTSVTTELTRLNPAFYDLAGAAAVSSLVESQLKDFGAGSTVFRWAGVDRYDTAAQLASLSGGLSSTVFLATGASFPDALGGSAPRSSHRSRPCSPAPRWNGGLAPTAMRQPPRSPRTPTRRVPPPRTSPPERTTPMP